VIVPDAVIGRTTKWARRTGHQPPRLRLPELPELPLAGPCAVRL